MHTDRCLREQLLELADLAEAEGLPGVRAVLLGTADAVSDLLRLRLSQPPPVLVVAGGSPHTVDSAFAPLTAR
jgi:hypothetical protein